MKERLKLLGKKFGRLFVVSDRVRDVGRTYCLCLCDCGNYKTILSSNLIRGKSISCGCFRSEYMKKTKTIHGKAPRNNVVKEYSIYHGMISRCYNTNVKAYINYGGRGIKVCDRWLESFENFYEDVGERPTPKHSLDRIDNNGIYEPSNCRWVTQKEQSGNTRQNVWYEYNGQKMIQKDWAILFNTHPTNILNMLKRGASFDDVYHKFTKK